MPLANKKQQQKQIKKKGKTQQDRQNTHKGQQRIIKTKCAYKKLPTYKSSYKNSKK